MIRKRTSAPRYGFTTSRASISTRRASDFVHGHILSAFSDGRPFIGMKTFRYRRQFRTFASVCLAAAWRSIRASVMMSPCFIERISHWARRRSRRRQQSRPCWSARRGSVSHCLKNCGTPAETNGVRGEYELGLVRTWSGSPLTTFDSEPTRTCSSCTCRSKVLCSLETPATATSSRWLSEPTARSTCGTTKTTAATG